MNLRCSLSCLWLSCLLLLFATAVPAAELLPAQPQLGERARLTLPTVPADSTEWPRGIGVVIRANEDPAIFEIVVLSVGEVGVFLPASGDSILWSVERQIETPTPELARPLYPGPILRPNWWPWWLAGTVLACLTLAMALLWWLRRQGRTPLIELSPIPPHQPAMERLAALEARMDQADGNWWEEASSLVRDFVDARFRVPAPSCTSEELRDRLLALGFGVELASEVHPLLAEADHVKFAGAAPDGGQAHRWVNGARELVQTHRLEFRYSDVEALKAARRLRGQ